MLLKDKKGNSLNLDTTNEIGSGGEGAIYFKPINKKRVLKIYHNAKPNNDLHFMELNKLPDEFVKPLELYYNSTGNFVGFEMEYIDSSKYSIFSNLLNKGFCLKNNITEKLKKKVYDNINIALKKAHDLDIVIGDLNQYNILFDLKTGAIIFLDVDSFGTKYQPHSGVMLADIRDWTAKKIDKNSDYYSWDVLMFYMFTYMHPFGGNLPPFKNIEDRTKNKKSIFCGDGNLKIPPTYIEFTDNKINDQFKRVFDRGERFIIDLDGNLVMNTTQLKATTTINAAGVSVIKITENVLDFFGNQNYLAVKTTSEFIIYDLKFYGAIKEIMRVKADNVYLGNKNIYYRFGNKLFGSNHQEINFIFPDNFGEIQYNDNQISSLFVVNYDTDDLHTMNLDSMINNKISINTTKIFAASVVANSSIYQNVSGNKWLFSPSNTNFNTIKIDKTKYNVKNIFYKNGYCCIEHIQNNNIKNTIVKIDGLNLTSNLDTDNFTEFDVKNNLVFIANNGSIDVFDLKTNTMVTSIGCNIVEKQSKIIIAHCGLVVNNNNTLYLINKK